MRIPGIPGLPDSTRVAPASDTQAITPKAAAVSAVASTATEEMQSAVMQPALASMRDMPEIDHAKVAALRDALARGELPFNAAKLAGLIERFHGSKS